MADAENKSRDDVKAQREAKKLAKLAKKNKKQDNQNVGSPKEVLSTKISDESGTKADKSKVAANKVADIPEKTVQVSVNPKSSESVTKSERANSKTDAATKKEGEKSKAELKAERRAKQEAQRAAKEATKNVPNDKEVKNKQPDENKIVKSKSENKGEQSTKILRNKIENNQIQPVAIKGSAKPSGHRPTLLSHLQVVDHHLAPQVFQNVHPAIIELGAKYRASVISGSNARCIALLQALKRVVVDFVTPIGKEFSRAVEGRLNESISFLNYCRQSSVSMTNALKHVKSHLTQLTSENIHDDEARRKLCDVIDTFIKEQIDVAGEAICNAMSRKIADGDTIAIYGCSSLLFRILVQSYSEGKQFKVVVVDGGPLFEGKEMCRRLVSEGIECCYILLPAFSYLVGQTTKVLLGAHALLANGCVMSRSGSASVALIAKAHNVPVIVCCETYKFSERVQADAFIHNQLGPKDIFHSLPSISLMYDMTPPKLVDAVATELAILPCTSVPVVLRIKPSDYYY